MDVVTLILRYLRARKIAMVSLLFITIGVMANIVVVAVMDGFQDRIRQHLRGTESDLTIRMRSAPPIEHLREVAEILRGETVENGGPIVSLAPHQLTLGMLGMSAANGLSLEDRMVGVRLVGIDYAAERKVLPFDRLLALRPEDAALRVPADRMDDPLGNLSLSGILIGTSLASAIGARVGDEVDVLTGDLKTKDGHRAFDPSNLRFQVVGCFDSGRDDYDMVYVYMTRDDFSRLKWGGEGVHPDCRSVQARITDPSQVQAVKSRLEAAYPQLQFESWEDKNQSLLGAIRTEKMIIVIILFFIVLIAAGSILGILYMMVIEKTRDIGILRSMGLSRTRVVLVFMGCGAVLGLVGASLGLFLGYEFTIHVNDIREWLAERNIEVFSEKIYKFKDVPAKLVPSWFIGTGVVAFLLAVLAGVVPAAMAARLDPVRCLKDD